MEDPCQFVDTSLASLLWSAIDVFICLQFYPCYIPAAETFTGKLLAPILPHNQIQTSVYPSTSSIHESP